MIPSQQITQERILELRRFCDLHFQDFSKLMMQRSTADLRASARDLGIEHAELGIDGVHDERAELAIRQLLVSKITDLVKQTGGYLYVEGRLEIVPDGSGFLRDVHLGYESVHTAGQYDNYDVYVPTQLILSSRLENDDTIAGLRRWPYPGEEYLVLLEASEVKHAGPSSAANGDFSVKEGDVSVANGSDDMEEPRPGSKNCGQCMYLRKGHSLARSTFDMMLEPLKAQLQSSYTRTLQGEAQASGETIAEREINIQQKILNYTRRPTDPNIQYCGVDEFKGQFYICEVKNPYGGCEEFSGRGSVPASHSCKSCRHNQQPLVKLFQVVEQTAGSRPKGQQIRDEIRQSLQYQADTEYETCVEATGIAGSRLGLLPVCQAHSSLDESEPRYVIGPVVNLGQTCELWETGYNEASAHTITELNTLVARAQQAVKEYTSPSVMDDNIYASTNQRQSDAGNAQAEVIEYCLQNLGASQDFIDSICSRYTLDVWFSERKKPDGADAGTDAGFNSAATPAATGTGTSTAGGQQPQGFQITINTTYRHPRIEDLVFVVYQYPPYFTAQVNYIMAGKQELFDLSRFQPGVWTQLIGQRGPLPIALAITGMPLHQFYAMWL